MRKYGGTASQGEEKLWRKGHPAKWEEQLKHVVCTCVWQLRFTHVPGAVTSKDSEISFTVRQDSNIFTHPLQMARTDVREGRHSFWASWKRRQDEGWILQMLVSGADDHKCPCSFMFFLGGGVTTSRKLPNSFSTAGIR